jgi:HD-like signal output (HDOD) protein
MGRVETSEVDIVRMLASAGLVNEHQLKDAIAVKNETGERIVNILMAQGTIDPKRFVEFLAQPGRAQSVELGDFDIASELIAVVPRNFAVMHKVVPVERDGEVLTVACTGPLEPAVIEALSEHTGYEIKTLICPADAVRRSLARHYEGAPVGGSALGNLEGPLKLNMAVAMLRHIESLPALPGTVNKIREIIYDKDGSATHVAEAISQDPAIAAKVLRVANSAAYGFSHKVDSVQLAVSLLGLVETYSIVVSSAVINVFDKSRKFDYMAFWLESQCCARVARALSKFLELKNHSGVFSAGLLHDIGRVALVQIVPKHYERVSPTLAGQELMKAEGDALGLTHTEAGYELAQHWDLPADLAECIRFHHSPQHASDQNRTTVSIVNIAEAVARAHPNPGEPLELDLSECDAAMRMLDLKEEEIAEVAASVPRPAATETLWVPA